MTPLQTAAPIAKIRAEEAHRPEAERLFADPYAALFAEADAGVLALFHQIPFFTEHVRLRTRYIDDAVRSALGAGIRTIVLVGAGFDTRGLRMHEIAEAGARVIEVDHGEQLTEKRRRFEAAGFTLPASVVHAPADLAEPGELERALTAAGTSPREPALFICEGLFGYLSRDAIRSLAERTASLAGSGSRLLGNHNVTSWSSSALVEVFTGSGWKPEAGPVFDELHRRYLGPAPPPGGEAFAFLEASK